MINISHQISINCRAKSDVNCVQELLNVSKVSLVSLVIVLSSSYQTTEQKSRKDTHKKYFYIFAGLFLLQRETSKERRRLCRQKKT